MDVFEFQELIPDLRLQVMMHVPDAELVNLCLSSKAMEDFCNTKDLFWRQRLEVQFGISHTDSTVQAILARKGTWFRVYFTLLLLRKLQNKLKPLSNYTLLELYNLKSLRLYSNQLTELPKEIGELINLQWLYLRNNQLTELPKEIGKLVNLQRLDLSFNQITKLPKEIGELINLQWLYLNNNQLTELPTEIGNLVNLQVLYLDKNQLTELPTEIGELINLQWLYLRNNQLTELPTELLPNTTIYS